MSFLPSLPHPWNDRNSHGIFHLGLVVQQKVKTKRSRAAVEILQLLKTILKYIYVGKFTQLYLMLVLGYFQSWFACCLWTVKPGKAWVDLLQPVWFSRTYWLLGLFQLLQRNGNGFSWKFSGQSPREVWVWPLFPPGQLQYWNGKKVLLCWLLNCKEQVLTVNHGYLYTQWLLCRFISQINN